MKSFNNVKFKNPYVLEHMNNENNFTKGISTLIKLLERDGYKCFCCGKTNLFMMLNEKNRFVIYTKHENKHIRMTLDHDLLKSLGGSDCLTNLHALCEECNSNRGCNFTTYDEFKKYYDYCIKKFGKFKKYFKKYSTLKRNFYERKNI